MGKAPRCEILTGYDITFYWLLEVEDQQNVEPQVKEPLPYMELSDPCRECHLHFLTHIFENWENKKQRKLEVVSSSTVMSQTLPNRCSQHSCSFNPQFTHSYNKCNCWGKLDFFLSLPFFSWMKCYCDI